MTDDQSNDDAGDRARSDPSGPLTAFQVEVAREFFALPSAQGFLLAGGAALAAHGLTSRPTQDLDLFTSPGRGGVRATLAAFVAAAAERGWDLDVIRESVTFARAVVRGGADAVVVDLAVDATPQRPPTVTFVGPTLDPTSSPPGRSSRCSTEPKPVISPMSTFSRRGTAPRGHSSWPRPSMGDLTLVSWQPCSIHWPGSTTKKSLSLQVPM